MKVNYRILGIKTDYRIVLSNSIFQHLHRIQRIVGKKKIQSMYFEVLRIVINTCWAFGQELLSTYGKLQLIISNYNILQPSSGIFCYKFCIAL